MEKSIFTQQYRVLLDLLREQRRGAGVTQVELAKRLLRTQSFVSKAERGEIRLDVVQLRTICLAIDTTLGEFIAEFERRVSRPKRRRGADSD